MAKRKSDGSRAGQLRRGFPTRTPIVRDQIRTLEKTLDSGVSILLQGETGSGKDYLAELIHASSRRSSSPLVRIPCASIPPDLFESELFGYEKGAFTDARERKKGLIETAHGGTLYLDEIALLPKPFQAKLLRLVQEKTFTRIGGVAELSVDIRVIASSTIPLETLVRRGEFRDDLFYRLNVISIHLLPLRERPADIPRLAEILLERESGALGRVIRGFSPEALELLRDHEWPGNVRELRSVIRRAVVLEESETVTVEALPVRTVRNEESLIRRASTAGWSLERVEEAYIREVLRRTGDNNSRAARILGISRKTLIEKRRRYGIVKNGKQ